MPEFFCGGATDTVVYVPFADIKEKDLVLEVGMSVLFKFWQDNDTVGGCEVTSANPRPSSLPKSARRKSYRSFDRH